MRTSKVLTIVGIIVAAVALAFFIGWYASREPKSTESGPQTAPSTGTEKPGKDTTAAKPGAAATEPVIEPVTNETAEAETSAATNSPTQIAEEKFDALWEDPNLDTDQMAAKMLELYPKLSVQAQKENIGHILNLVPDEGFAPVGKILTNPKTPEDVSDEIMTDLGNRPGVIRMPLLLDVAKNANHPKAAEAKELLELYIEPEEELGDDWTKWEAAMKKYLEENPD